MQGLFVLKTASDRISGAIFITTSGKTFTRKRSDVKLKNQHFHHVFPKCLQNVCTTSPLSPNTGHRPPPTTGFRGILHTWQNAEAPLYFLQKSEGTCLPAHPISPAYKHKGSHLHGLFPAIHQIETHPATWDNQGHQT